VELGIYFCGGRGRHSRNTPDELRAVAQVRGLDGEALVRTSRPTARVDNNAIADGFQIYLHTFILSTAGDWAVVQQGMNGQGRPALRADAAIWIKRSGSEQSDSGALSEYASFAARARA